MKNIGLWTILSCFSWLRLLYADAIGRASALPTRFPPIGRAGAGRATMAVPRPASIRSSLTPTPMCCGKLPCRARDAQRPSSGRIASISPPRSMGRMPCRRSTGRASRSGRSPSAAKSRENTATAQGAIPRPPPMANISSSISRARTWQASTWTESCSGKPTFRKAMAETRSTGTRGPRPS